jgi:hypothetical protein
VNSSCSGPLWSHITHFKLFVHRCPSPKSPSLVIVSASSHLVVLCQPYFTSHHRSGCAPLSLFAAAHSSTLSNLQSPVPGGPHTPTSNVISPVGGLTQRAYTIVLLTRFRVSEQPVMSVSQEYIIEGSEVFPRPAMLTNDYNLAQISIPYRMPLFVASTR